jgi:DNA invertase Pin-like site-specific DNA recombinase
MLDALAPSKAVTMTRIERLTRSTRDLLNALAAIADRGAGFRSIADAWGRHQHGARSLTA